MNCKGLKRLQAQFMQSYYLYNFKNYFKHGRNDDYQNPELNIDDKLKQIRQQGQSVPTHHMIETYTSQGMSRTDAITYIEFLKT